MNDNTGTLFLNNYKTEDKHPKYKGKVIIDGTEKEIAAWEKVDKNGNTILSLKVSDKRTV